jgi:hypothetical protein
VDQARAALSITNDGDMKRMKNLSVHDGLRLGRQLGDCLGEALVAHEP